MNIPAIQLYLGDYLRDAVSGCSLAAQGLWLRLLMMMHDSERYGYLCHNGVPIPSQMLARRCGCSLEEFNTCLAELEAAGVPSRTQNGIIYCRRMARKELDRVTKPFKTKQDAARRQAKFRAKRAEKSTAYGEKLKDPRWQKKRLEIFSRDNWECTECHDRSSTLHIHHKEYVQGRDPWDYPDQALTTLCEACHKQGHLTVLKEVNHG